MGVISVIKPEFFDVEGRTITVHTHCEGLNRTYRHTTGKSNIVEVDGQPHRVFRGEVGDVLLAADSEVRLWGDFADYGKITAITTKYP